MPLIRTSGGDAQIADEIEAVPSVHAINCYRPCCLVGFAAFLFCADDIFASPWLALAVIWTMGTIEWLGYENHHPGRDYTHHFVVSSPLPNGIYLLHKYTIIEFVKHGIIRSRSLTKGH
jgi:hypothetical protein